MKLKHTLLFTALAALNNPANALEKPKTMEEMWKIIEAQQQQIDAMKSQLQTGSTAQPQTTTTAAAKNTMQTLERKTDVLSQEVEKLRTNLTIPEETKYKSAYGLGPAASKVYQVGKGLSIGGYGEAIYQDYVGDKKEEDKNNADLERVVLYAGYKFTDRILFNSEIEFEHASSGEGDELKGEVGVEFAALDFFIDPLANIRTGLVLMPMGFINQIHEPPFFYGNHRPEVEQRIIPSTWREMGVGLFGQITPSLTYTTYLVNGLDASGFQSSGIKEGRGGGSQAKSEDFGYVGRMDYTPTALPGMTLGGSVFVGNSGQNQSFAGQKADVFTQLYEGHVQWKYRGLEFRTLGSWGHIDNADILSAAAGQTIGSSNYGWYSEVGYDIFPLFRPDTLQYLAPFFRYERFDTIATAPTGYSDDGTQDQRIYQFGLQYKPIPNVVIKADYRNRTARQGTVPDDFNLGFGFIF
ncbi:hypothetical protein [Methylovulum miyakonense]|uniref:hypothetical protein n=1 Tax=Methylovulum miyakonense TaxID=645578 RepID=UPI00036B5573|nr:hypothetical protein [Methylovulum miyakonense]